MDRTPYLTVVEGFSSTLSLTILTLPWSSLESSSSTGAMARQGPHHSAQKSTSTGSLEDRTSSPKLASETWVVIGLPFGLKAAVCVIQKLGRVQCDFNKRHRMVNPRAASTKAASGNFSSDSNSVQRIPASILCPGKS